MSDGENFTGRAAGWVGGMIIAACLVFCCGLIVGLLSVLIGG